MGIIGVIEDHFRVVKRNLLGGAMVYFEIYFKDHTWGTWPTNDRFI